MSELLGEWAPCVGQDDYFDYITEQVLVQFRIGIIDRRQVVSCVERIEDKIGLLRAVRCCNEEQILRKKGLIEKFKVLLVGLDGLVGLPGDEYHSIKSEYLASPRATAE